MSYDIGPRIGIEGEKEFKRAISDINKDMSVLGSELGKVAAQFDGSANSMAALQAKSDVYNKQIDAQRDKIETLRSALANSAKEFGDNDVRTKNWQISLNKAEAELAKLNTASNENAMYLDEAKKAVDGHAKLIDEAGKKAKQSGEDAKSGETGWSKFGDGLAMVGKAAAAAAAVATAAAVKIGKEVIEAFGGLEQNLGGSEAVFGQYAASIQKTGEEAYKNLGVSQSDYLATANKMGALFQGSGVDQQKSLELTEKAMQRAADMASVMGIDMQVALDSVAGAAKGNFTMMDNLGVAMNATTIEAYAAGKGLDFVWSKASQAEKAEIAMQMFFENTEQYAGNFAKESTETISGSIGLLQAAFESFAAGLGNTDADMKNLTENLTDALKTVVKNVVPIIGNLTSALPEVFKEIIPALGAMLPSLLETATALLSQVIDSLVQLLPQLIPVAVAAMMTITEALIDNLPLIVDGAFLLVMSLANGIIEALPTLIPKIVEVITTIVQQLIENIPMVIDAGIQLIIGLTEGLIAAIPIIINALPQLIASLLDGLLLAIPEIIKAGITLLTSLVSALPDIIAAIVAAIPQIIDSVIDAVIGAIPMLIEAGIQLFIALIQNLPTIITTIVTAIPEIIGSIVDALIDNIDEIILAGVQLFVALIENLPIIIVEVVKAVPQIIDGIVTAIGKLAYKLADAGGNLIKGLWKGISDAGAWLWDKISGFFGNIVDGVKDFFGIHSPSTVFAGFGKNMALGLGEGFVGEMGKVSDQINGSVPTDFNITGGSVAAPAGNAGQGGTVEIKVSVANSLDGRELARGMYKYFVEMQAIQGKNLVNEV